MEMIALFLFCILLLTSVSLFYVSYQLRKARGHLEDAMKVCEDAVKSLRSGGV